MKKWISLGFGLAALTALLSSVYLLNKNPSLVAKKADASTGSELQGRLEIYHEDNFDNKTTKISYALITNDNKWYRVVFPSSPQNLKSGSIVKIKGSLSGNILTSNSLGSPDTLQTISTPANTSIPAGPKKTAVLLARFNDTRTDPYTPDQIRSFTFTDPLGINSYFKETSFNLTQLVGHENPAGDVFGYYTVPYPSNQACTLVWMPSVQQQAAAQGHDLSRYQFIIYFFPHNPTCQWNGMAEVGGKNAWVNGLYSLTVAGHEVGHLYGNGHANAKDCRDSSGARVSYSPNCTWREYGDPTNIMGIGSTRQMTSFNKGTSSWLQPNNTITVTTPSTHTIYPLEFSSSNILSLRIPISVGFGYYGDPVTFVYPNYYYLAYRRPFGLFDNFSNTDAEVNGVTIRSAGVYEPQDANLHDMYLIDTTPETSSFSDAALALNKTYLDQYNGISIRTQSVSNASATVTVSFTPGVPLRLTSSIEGPAVKLSWSKFYTGTISDYHIERCTGSSCTNYLQIGTTQNLNYSDSSVVSNTTYRYRIRAHNHSTNLYSTYASTSITTPVLPITWTIRTQPVCQGGSPVTSKLTAVNYALWPPNPLTWTSDLPAIGAHTKTITSTDASNGIYVQLINAESGVGSLPGYSVSPPHPGFVFGTYFSSSSPMVRFDRTVPAGNYTIFYLAPGAWCLTTRPTPTPGCTNCQ